MALTIPKGKIVRFSGSGLPQSKNDVKAVSEYEFLLEEDINIKATSRFGSVVDGDSSKFFNLGAGVIRGISGGTFNIPVGNKYLGFQQWEGTEPLSFSFNIGVYMGANGGLLDVIYPIKSLMKLALPSIDTSGVLKDLGNFTAPGPDAYSVFTSKKDRQLNVEIGTVSLRSVIITNIDATFSLDEDSDGYPIFAKVRVDLKTIFTANDQIIDQLFLGKYGTIFKVG